MKRLRTVFEFEFMNYVKNKSFIITTILMVLVIGVVMFLPRMVDMSEILGTKKAGVEQSENVEDKEESGDKVTLGLLDKTGILKDSELLTEAFGKNTAFVHYEDREALKNAVKDGTVLSGFYVSDDSHYEYFVLNRDMEDTNQATFDEVMTLVHKQVFCEANGIDYEKLVTGYEVPVECSQQILGKDATQNFWYCYALVMVIFMVIIIYGVMIATSVTQEKSNRSIEVLVTSIDSKYLLFGKVLAGAAAVILQMTLILGVALAGYATNRAAWGNKLDMVLHIPGNVVAAFAIFGIGGFLFYAFLYGALGALVSKTEDINKSCGILQMFLMIVYFISMSQLQNVDSIVMKVCSYLPFSSYSAMFVRIAMGKVELYEVIISAIILYACIIGAGWLGAKIYRMGTLRYGNPIKLSRALKEMKQAE